jgi:hypothetical protein
MAINILSLPNVKAIIQQLISEKGCTKGLENQPAFIRCGVGFDSESTTISHIEVEKGKKKDMLKTEHVFGIKLLYRKHEKMFFIPQTPPSARRSARE